MNVGVGMFKDSSLMGTVPLPSSPPSMTLTSINMISSFTSQSLWYFDPWVIPRPEEVESYGASIPLTTIDIVSLMISSTSTNIDLQLHPHT